MLAQHLWSISQVLYGLWSKTSVGKLSLIGLSSRSKQKNSQRLDEGYRVLIPTEMGFSKMRDYFSHIWRSFWLASGAFSDNLISFWTDTLYACTRFLLIYWNLVNFFREDIKYIDCLRTSVKEKLIIDIVTANYRIR